MRFTVLIAEDAERDIEDLYGFIARRDGAATADRLLSEIEDVCFSLSEMPGRGNIPKELAPLGISDYRELHHKPWRIIYRISGANVVIYCVADGRRDMRSFLERRLLR